MTALTALRTTSSAPLLWRRSAKQLEPALKAVARAGVCHPHANVRRATAQLALGIASCCARTLASSLPYAADIAVAEQRLDRLKRLPAICVG